MNFFGPHTACQMDGIEQVITPVGDLCAWCETAIEAHDRGYIIPHVEFLDDSPLVNEAKPWHLECFIRSLVGSVGHQLGKCRCYGGNFEDRPGRTKREAALDAYLNFINKMRIGQQ